MNKLVKDMTNEEITQLPKVDVLFMYTVEDGREKYRLWVLMDSFVKSLPIDLGATMSIVALSQKWPTKPKPKEKKHFKLHARLTKGVSKEPRKSGKREWFYRIELFLHRDAEKTTTLTAFMADKDIPYIKHTNLDEKFCMITSDVTTLLAKEKSYA